ncbi:type II secretion system protein [bacterium]|nr:type II secretion system protein [bacterium]
MRTPRPCAFTLIELLIVVAIISVLAAIAVPNFLTAQVRAKVARAESDMHELGTGLEAYYTDHASYPLEDGYWGVDFKAFVRLTTPVKYLSSMPIDAFNTRMTPDTDIGFYNIGTGSTRMTGATPNTDRDVYVIASYGPDLSDDTHYIMYFPRTNNACPYDISNGVMSRGDIYRLSPSTVGMWAANFRAAANPRNWPNP